MGVLYYNNPFEKGVLLFRFAMLPALWDASAGNPLAGSGKIPAWLQSDFSGAGDQAEALYRAGPQHLKGETSNYLFKELLRWESVLKGPHIGARRVESSCTNY